MRPVQPRTVLVRDGLGLSSTDVVLNLFLFFVIAFALIATFKKKEATEKQQQTPPTPPVKVIDLPRSTTARAEPAPGSVVIESDARGGVFIDGTAVSRAELTQALRQRFTRTKRPVVLRAAKGIALGDAVDLLDLINAAGPESVSLSTVEPSPQR